VATPTRDDVWLCLHLYEQRREPALRAAREWLIEFSPKSFKDIKNVLEGRTGVDENRHWRQATTYWEMIASLMMCGGISPEARELFASTTREWFVFFAKIAPYLDQIRAATRPGLFQNLERFCKSLPDYESNLATYARLNAQIAERVARARKGKGRKRR
jgi:hypothetical protein